jgi:23S rRNA pseudouridine1911/1915/1917 synthase
MAHINHPLVGDPLYGGRMLLPKGATEEMRKALRSFRRQALHAARLGLVHPGTGEDVSWEAPLPNDMSGLLELLEQEAPWRGYDSAR